MLNLSHPIVDEFKDVFHGVCCMVYAPRSTDSLEFGLNICFVSTDDEKFDESGNILGFRGYWLARGGHRDFRSHSHQGCRGE
jgi:hypothetical protein